MIPDRQLFGPFGPKRFESRWLLDQAKDQPCVRCGADDKTIVPAHYHGMYAHLFGKGGSIKADDFMVAHLCHACHVLFDSTELDKSPWETDAEREMELLVCICRTIRRLVFQGSVVVAKGSNN